MVRPVVQRAIEDFGLEDKWNFNLEFISDGKCDNEVTITNSGSLRYYNHHPNQSVCCKEQNATCHSFCDNFHFKSRLADVYIGMPCDYVYGMLLELSRAFNSGDLTNKGFAIEGTGFPMLVRYSN